MYAASIAKSLFKGKIKMFKYLLLLHNSLRFKWLNGIFVFNQF